MLLTPEDLINVSELFLDKCSTVDTDSVAYWANLRGKVEAILHTQLYTHPFCFKSREEVAAAVRNMRLFLRVTQEGLSQLLGCDRLLIAKWEKGDGAPSLDVFTQIVEMVKKEGMGADDYLKAHGIYA